LSNTSKGKGKKGSKFWMQMVINTKCRLQLNESIGDNIQWLSPLINQDDYAEYELKHQYISDITGIKKEKFSFWPERQPQWDAIGINAEKKVLYLIEAKAHLNELNSKMNASSKVSQQKIESAMRYVFDNYYPEGNFDRWKDSYYQMGNRLTFLHFLNNITSETGWKVKLVLLNFVDDFTYKPTTLPDWENHYRDVFKEMTGHESEPVDLKMIYYSVKNKGVVKSPINGELIYDVSKVLSYGYSNVENERIRAACPSGCILYECGQFSDLLAMNGIYSFVNISALSDDELKTLLEFQQFSN
jgi:hypothetical protein